MTLEQLLGTLDSSKIMASVVEKDGTLVTEIKASTYASLDDAIEAREVDKWQAVSATAIKVILKEV